MCLAIPARIETIEGDQATVDLDGVLVEVSLALTPEARVGDHVIVHVGYALSVVDPEEVRRTLAALDDLAGAVAS